jgi:POT family proton-dependent oligopeptide transporter
MADTPASETGDPRDSMEFADPAGIGEALRTLSRASRGFWLVNWVNFGDGVAYFGFLALMTLFLQKDVGFAANTATRAVSVFTGLVTLFMAAGAGALSDRLGSRRALTLSLTIILGGRLLFTASPFFGPALAAGAAAWGGIALMGFGEGVIQPALYAGVKEYTDRRTATMGYAYLYAIMNLGVVAGEVISPLVREAYAAKIEGVSVQQQPTAGITGAYGFFIAITALVIVVHLLFFTRKVERRDRIQPGQDEGRESKDEGLLERIKSLPILDRRFMFFIFVLFPVRTLFAHQWLTMPDYVTRCFAPEVGARWEWINGLNPLIIVIGVPVIAALTQRRRVVDMMIVGTLVSALSTFMLAVPPNVPLLLTYVIVFSLGEAAWSSRFLEYVADIAPANKVGVYMGIAGLPWFLAKTVTGFYAGSMLDAFVPRGGAQNPETMWIIYGITAMISPAGLIVARRWLLSQEKAAPAPA